MQRKAPSWLERPLGWISTPSQDFSEDEGHEVLVVLGGGFQPNGQLRSSNSRRVQAAAAIYAERPVPVLFSGRQTLFSPGQSEAEAMCELAISAGVQPEHILLESKARNTYQNAEFACRMLADEGFNRIYLVTSPAHLYRAAYCFRRFGAKVAAPWMGHPALGIASPRTLTMEYGAFLKLFWRIKTNPSVSVHWK